MNRHVYEARLPFGLTVELFRNGLDYWEFTIIRNDLRVIHLACEFGE